MGKITDFVKKQFEEHRENKITLQELIVNLCSYADSNIRYECNWGIFQTALEEEFNEEGDIKQ